MRKLLVILPVFFGMVGNAQHLQKKVINSAGTVYTGSGLKLKVSVGEPVVGNLNINNSTVLSQGFFTGFSKSQAIDSVSTAGPVTENVSIYPNPVKDVLHIKGDLSQVKQGLIFDVAGHYLLTEPVSSGVLLLNNLPPGFYILKLMNKSNEVINVFKLVKRSS